MFPGSRITVQIPVSGSPDRFTLPVDDVQLGCIISPGMGAEGMGGWFSTTTSVEGELMHPSLFVTLKL